MPRILIFFDDLLTILDLKQRFPNCEIGFSDHTIGDIASITAVALGASIIEKHFVLNKKVNSIDNFFSSTNRELSQLIKNCKKTILSRGNNFYGPTKNEKNSIRYRRSIYVSKKIKKGERITKNNIQIVRPSYGLNLNYYDKIIGNISKKNLFPGDKIFLKYLK